MTERITPQQFHPSVLKKYSRDILQRGIDGTLQSLKIEAERRAAVPNGRIAG